MGRIRPTRITTLMTWVMGPTHHVLVISLHVSQIQRFSWLKPVCRDIAFGPCWPSVKRSDGQYLSPPTITDQTYQTPNPCLSGRQKPLSSFYDKPGTQVTNPPKAHTWILKHSWLAKSNEQIDKSEWISEQQEGFWASLLVWFVFPSSSYIRFEHGAPEHCEGSPKCTVPSPWWYSAHAGRSVAPRFSENSRCVAGSIRLQPCLWSVDLIPLCFKFVVFFFFGNFFAASGLLWAVGAGNQWGVDLVIAIAVWWCCNCELHGKWFE